jgi:hypothetical protein
VIDNRDWHRQLADERDSQQQANDICNEVTSSEKNASHGRIRAARKRIVVIDPGSREVQITANVPGDAGWT